MHLVDLFLTIASCPPNHYNNARLNSAIGYITPKDMLGGQQQEIQAERDRKLEDDNPCFLVNRKCQSGRASHAARGSCYRNGIRTCRSASAVGTAAGAASTTRQDEEDEHSSCQTQPCPYPPSRKQSEHQTEG
jgi:hypothetical protein